MSTLTPAIFLDRDGTLMDDPGYVGDPVLVRVLPGVAAALALAKAHGFKTVIVTNQSGIGRGYFSAEDFARVNARLLALLGADLIDATYFCADHPETASARRKPEPGMLLEAARDLSLDLALSWMIGDRTGDLEAGRRAGVRSILVLTGEGARADAGGAEFVANDLVAAVDFILNHPDARQ